MDAQLAASRTSGARGNTWRSRTLERVESGSEPESAAFRECRSDEGT